MDELEFQLIHESSRQTHTRIIPEAVNTVVMLLMMKKISLETCRAVVMDEMEFQLIAESSRQPHTRLIPEAVNTVVMLLMMNKNIARNM